MVLAHAAWSAPPAVVAAAALAALLFAQGFVRLRRRGRPDLASWRRAALFGLALVVVLAGLVSPIDTLGEDDLLSLHMLQHVLIGDLGVALAVAALRGPLFVFFLPAALLGPLARSPLRRALGLLLRPRVACGLWALNLAVWHVPALYDSVLGNEALHDFEHACWMLAGVLVWTLLVDPGGHGRLGTGGRIALATAMFGSGTILADVLIFSFHGLYPAYEGAYGLSARQDQQLAGLVMMAEQLLTLGTLAVWLLRPRLGRQRVATA